MFDWLRERKRQKILLTPFPEEWMPTLERNVAHYPLLTQDERKQLRDLVQVFVEEKSWEGCGGLILTDEIRVTIAAHACILVLGLPHDCYRRVSSILVYPSTVVVPAEERVGVFEVPLGPVRTSMPILGQAFHRGPVILSWDSVLRTGRNPVGGSNMVYHEFAHQLDMLSGGADGTPPLELVEEYSEWVRICEREFLQLKRQTESGEKTFLDDYASVNEAEFFAVITEQFFDQPRAMKGKHPDLYLMLSRFYRQNPAERQET